MDLTVCMKTAISEGVTYAVFDVLNLWLFGFAQAEPVMRSMGVMLISLGFWSCLAWLASKQEPPPQPKHAKENSDRWYLYEGVTPMAATDFALANSGDEDCRNRRDQEEVISIFLADPRYIGADMPPAMMHGYNAPVAIPAQLKGDIDRLLAALEAQR